MIYHLFFLKIISFFEIFKIIDIFFVIMISFIISLIFIISFIFLSLYDNNSIVFHLINILIKYNIIY